jgi:hypothetical protein
MLEMATPNTPTYQKSTTASRLRSSLNDTDIGALRELHTSQPSSPSSGKRKKKKKKGSVNQAQLTSVEQGRGDANGTEVGRSGTSGHFHDPSTHSDDNHIHDHQERCDRQTQTEQSTLFEGFQMSSTPYPPQERPLPPPPKPDTHSRGNLDLEETARQMNAKNIELTRDIKSYEKNIKTLQTHCKAYHSENERLSRENQTVYDDNRRLGEDLSRREREIKHIKTDLRKLQDTGFQQVDRTVVDIDSDIASKFEYISGMVKTLARSSLSKAKSNMEDKTWLAKVLHNMDAGSFYEKSPLFHEPLTTQLRSQLLCGVFWRFLGAELFDSPFLCFGGQQSRDLDELWKKLFPNPRT